MKKLALGMALLAPLALYPTQQNGENGLGNNTAPITLEIYSDFECPHCKTFHDTTMQSVIQDYVNPGKVYLIHRDFPLSQHKYAREAALYAKAAARFNKYEAVSDALFKNQLSWSANGKVEEVIAKVLTPDEMKKARLLIKDPQLNQQIDNEIAAGYRAKVNSTPTLVVTHRMRTSTLPTDVSYPMLRRYFDDLLSR